MKTIRNENGEQVGSQVHTFERAGLGKAPFRFVGQEVILHQTPGEAPRAGASCDYCGTAIAQVFWIKGSDDRPRFKVGCDCVAKTGDAGLKRVINAKVAAMRTEAAHKRADQKIEKAFDMLADDSVRARLAELPHPRGWEGRSRLDWANWMMDNAGRKGRCEVAKFLMGLS